VTAVRADLGTLPDWLAALGTSGALVIALVLLVRQLPELGAAARGRETALADRAAAWVEADDHGGATLVLRNGGPMPIIDIEVIVDGRGVVPEDIEEVRRVTLPRLLPDAVDRRPVPPWSGHCTDAPLERVRVTMEFYDYRGSHWMLIPGESLTRTAKRRTTAHPTRPRPGT
jgi:hypothetical protein